jgi:hypothetical protein
MPSGWRTQSTLRQPARGPEAHNQNSFKEEAKGRNISAGNDRLRGQRRSPRGGNQEECGLRMALEAGCPDASGPAGRGHNKGWPVNPSTEHSMLHMQYCIVAF